MKTKKNLFILAVMMGVMMLVSCGNTSEQNTGAADTDISASDINETEAEEETEALLPDDVNEPVNIDETEDEEESDVSPQDDIHEPVDITDLNTFTQIVDKLSPGQGYANVNLVNQDVLLVSSGTYDLDVDKGERFGAIDADVYMYDEDGSIVYLGYVQAGGTAYPLAMDVDRHLCVGSNHSMDKMTIDADDKIAVDEEVYVVYDSDGNETYYHVSDVAQVEQDPEGKLSDDSLFNLFFENYFDAEIILFDTVK